mmetsp:Transcript_27235/g.85050  ORF Transcript_27235/g.85050 Transcript_27235/m.85050 type:complete len:252 (+) Transcript_27235:678-1433(+)
MIFRVAVTTIACASLSQRHTTPRLGPCAWLSKSTTGTSVESWRVLKLRVSMQSRALMKSSCGMGSSPCTSAVAEETAWCSAEKSVERSTKKSASGDGASAARRASGSLAARRQGWKAKSSPRSTSAQRCQTFQTEAGNPAGASSASALPAGVRRRRSAACKSRHRKAACKASGRLASGNSSDLEIARQSSGASPSSTGGEMCKQDGTRQTTSPSSMSSAARTPGTLSGGAEPRASLWLTKPPAARTASKRP